MTHETALVILDVQLGMFDENDPVFNGSELLIKISNLLVKARTEGISVVFIQHCGDADHILHVDKPGWPIHPSIAPKKDELVIFKRHYDSFQDTCLQEELNYRNIKHLVITGIQTEFCFDTTCRRAYSLGYKVTVVKDGHSTWDTEDLTANQIIDHHNRLLNGRFATVKAANEIEFEELS
jgi:nicotinamidase-related amidase